MDINVGDKLVIKCANEIPEYPQFGFNNDMKKYCGKTVTVVRLDPRAPGKPLIGIKEDGGRWAWSVDMVKEVLDKKNPNAIKTLDKLDNRSLFRVGGLFEGKARVCKVAFTDAAGYVPSVIFITMAGPVGSVTLEEVVLTNKLRSGEVTIMCIERG
jgi:hypothetical protein